MHRNNTFYVKLSIDSLLCIERRVGKIETFSGHEKVSRNISGNISKKISLWEAHCME